MVSLFDLSQKENVREDILRLGKGVLSVEVDLMEPIDANKPPKVNVPALNHIGLWVDDLQVCPSSASETRSSMSLCS